MKEKGNMILVDTAVLPEVFGKVLDAKKLIRMGDAPNINDAVKKVGISRSAFYKYKDFVFPFNEMQGNITFFCELMDISGVLSEILRTLADAGCNILTINQNIPMGGVANITISVRTDDIKCDTDYLLDTIKKIKGVNYIQILARED